MANYIEREAAIKATTENDCEGYATWAIKAIPAADVAPVRHGRWLHTPTWWIYCSECGNEPPKETNIATQYCPNCGAKMDEVEDAKEE